VPLHIPHQAYAGFVGAQRFLMSCSRAVRDPYAAVRIDVDVVRGALPAGLLVSGLVYDTDTGLIEVVVPPTT
jgi:hypothetical protein